MMAAWFASHAPWQALTQGEEGFWQGRTGSRYTLYDADPEPWGAITGQDFTTNEAPPGITYASTHLWPRCAAHKAAN